ncbi:MAG: nitroreductase family protein [Selenomonadaceae bacterium]|nr:nitroreductase family protein [Selenomonadaceae bacterium]
MKKSITIDKNKCIHCGMCIKDCVVNCIEFDSEKIPKYVEGGDKMCVGCQHCMAICPIGALSFGGKNPDDSDPVGYGNSDDLLRLIKSRRSVRFYKNQDVPQEKIAKLTEMLAYPPTGGNVDTLHFSIVGTAEKMQAIRKFTYEKVCASDSDSPVIKFAKDGYNNGKDIIYRGAPSMVAVSVNNSKVIPGCENADPIIAMSYLELYAQSLGLGTLWCDLALTIAQIFPEVRALLEIPEGYTLNYTMLLGVPNVKYKRTVQREPANVKII